MTVTRAESGMEWTTVDGGCCKMAAAIFLYFSESRNLVVSPNCLVYCNGKRATPLCGISWQNLIRFYLRKSIKKERKTEAASTRRLLLRLEKSVCLPQTTPSQISRTESTANLVHFLCFDSRAASPVRVRSFPSFSSFRPLICPLCKNRRMHARPLENGYARPRPYRSPFPNQSG